MIIGTGIDIVHIPRIERAARRFGKRFLTRAFCPGEIDCCTGKRIPWPCLAGRFAAKEALVKALGTGFRYGIALTDICVNRLDNGRPEIVLYGNALKYARRLGVTALHVSISHEKSDAIAMVILEGDAGAEPCYCPGQPVGI